MLLTYAGLKINYKTRMTASSYTPSALMMDYIIHQINTLLVDNFHFRRACPNYHPYILRLYYAILFWIQCLRASHIVNALDSEADQTLIYFLDTFPPESLPISGPLLDLFKTLCCSTPEIATYGKVYPSLPTSPGPKARSSFIRDEPLHFILPNIPGIFALLADLDNVLNPNDPSQAHYPSKSKHIPVRADSEDSVIFGHHSFPILANRTDKEKWSLVSSGLQYPCEADKKLHENFAERIGYFDFPPQDSEDNLTTYVSFFHMNETLAWFFQIREVATTVASFFEGSGTLADCFPNGIRSNQVVVHYQAPTIGRVAPTCSADPLALFPFSIKLKSSARNLSGGVEAMAALAQTNVEIFDSHPFLGSLGLMQRLGAFWSISPVESSSKDESSYHSIHGIVKGLMKPKG